MKMNENNSPCKMSTVKVIHWKEMLNHKKSLPAVNGWFSLCSKNDQYICSKNDQNICSKNIHYIIRRSASASSSFLVVLWKGCPSCFPQSLHQGGLRNHYEKVQLHVRRRGEDRELHRLPAGQARPDCHRAHGQGWPQNHLHRLQVCRVTLPIRGGLLKIASVGIPTYAGVKTGFRAPTP